VPGQARGVELEDGGPDLGHGRVEIVDWITVSCSSLAMRSRSSKMGMSRRTEAAVYAARMTERRRSTN
jgi:hypothetical protein